MSFKRVKSENFGGSAMQVPASPGMPHTVAMIGTQGEHKIPK